MTETRASTWFPVASSRAGLEPVELALVNVGDGGTLRLNLLRADQMMFYVRFSAEDAAKLRKALLATDAPPSSFCEGCE